jgi:hypothetical protein
VDQSSHGLVDIAFRKNQGVAPSDWATASVTVIITAREANAMHKETIIPWFLVHHSTRAMEGAASAFLCATDVEVCSGAINSLAKAIVRVVAVRIVRWTFKECARSFLGTAFIVIDSGACGIFTHEERRIHLHDKGHRAFMSITPRNFVATRVTVFTSTCPCVGATRDSCSCNL